MRRQETIYGIQADLLVEWKGKDLVVHLASYPRMIEGISEVEYIKLNFGGLMQVVFCMREAGVKKILFSSSGAAYGIERGNRFKKDNMMYAEYLPIDEDYPRSPDECLNMYGKTKLACEDYLLSLTDIKGYVFRLDGPRVVETGGVLSAAHFWANISGENGIEFMQRLAEYDGPNDVFNIGDPTTNKFCPNTIEYAKEKYHPDTDIRLQSPTEPLYSVKKAQRLLGYVGKAVI